MDIVLLISAILLLLTGVAGSILPGLPGPPAAWAGLFLLSFASFTQISIGTLVLTGILALFAVASDYVIPALGAKKFGGSKYGSRGAILGTFAGIFVGPVGVLTGPFAGALVGELLYDPRNSRRAIRAAWGSFLGFLAGTGIKLIISLILGWYFIIAFF